MLRPDPAQPAAALRDDLAVWLARSAADEPIVVTTSGSTARPKRVVLRRSAVLASADATHARLGGPGAWLLALPHAYVAGVQVLVRSLHAGHEPVVRADGESLAAAAARLEGPRRYVSLVPTQLHRLLADEIEREGAEKAAGSASRDLDALAGLDAVLLGGGPVDPDLRARAADRGITTVATYGMAETAGGCVYDGRPLDGVEVRTDAEARIWLRGPMIFDRYEHDDAATQAALVDGWFRTSDVGEVEREAAGGQLLRVLSRADDVVVSGGVNVPGSVVAARLRTHPGVAAAEAIGVEDAEWGRRLVAFVVPASPEATASAPGPTSGELRAWVAAAHPRTWAPRTVVFVERIPRTDRGKVDRGALQQLLAVATGGR